MDGCPRGVPALGAPEAAPRHDLRHRLLRAGARSLRPCLSELRPSPRATSELFGSAASFRARGAGGALPDRGGAARRARPRHARRARCGVPRGRAPDRGHASNWRGCRLHRRRRGGGALGATALLVRALARPGCARLRRHRPGRCEDRREWHVCIREQRSGPPPARGRERAHQGPARAADCSRREP